MLSRLRHWLGSRNNAANDLGLRILAVFLALNALVIAWAWHALQLSLRQDEAQVASITQNLALSMDQKLATEVGRIDLSLQAVADELRRFPRPGAERERLGAFLKMHETRLGDIGHLRVADASGLAILGDSVDPGARINWSDRTYFKPLRDQPRAGLVVSDPLMSRTTHIWIIVFGRRFLDAEGRFAGVVLLAVPVTHFQGLLSGLDLGPGGVSLLRDSQYGLITRVPAISTSAGVVGDKGFSPELAATIASGKRNATYHSIRTADGIERINSYRRLESMPFHLVVGMGSDSYLGKWREEARNTGLVLVLFALTTGLSGFGMWRALLRIRRETERNRLLLRSASDGIHVIDGRGDVLEASDSFCAMLGYAREEVLGMNVRQWEARYNSEEVASILERLLSERDPTCLQTRHRRKDGSVIEVELTVSPLTLDDRDVLSVSARDISARKQAEERLRASEERLRFAMKAAGQAWYELNLVTGEATVDDEYPRMLGYEPAGFHSSMAHWLGRIHPDDVAGMKSALDEAVATGESRARQYRARTRGGDWKWLLSTGAVVERDGEGRPLRLSGIHMDVNGRVRTELELEQYRAHLENMVKARTAELKNANQLLADTQFAMDCAGIGIHWADFETGRFLYANRYAASLLGYSVEEMLKLSVWDIDPNFPPEAYARIRESIRAKGVLQFETTQITKQGSLVSVEMIVYHHAPDPDAPARFISFVTDITRRKEAEQALRQAKEAAETANVAKSAFLANMSHEIRTPLNAISGMVHILRRGDLAPAQRERLDKIEAASRLLLEIINGILDLSKIEAGKFVLEQTELRLDKLLADVAAILHDRAVAKGLRLAIDVESPARALLGDPSRLQQALLNYAGNAVKFTETGDVTLRARIETDDSEGVLVRFEVRDTGIGIPADALPRLFHAFEQADNSTTRKYGGTGLGLAITRKIAEVMGGEAGAISTPGVGSTFWFTARLKKGEDSRLSRTPETTEPAEDVLRRDHAGRRILLAEDDDINREISLDMLLAAGLDADVAVDVIEAVDMAATTAYDLILMDVQMPRMDGLDATRRLRAIPGRVLVPIIAMTANAFADDRARCLAAGMDDFIAKPVDPEILYATILRWLDEAGDGGRPPAR
jgi:two-component system sensor histidine kinase/response regulator